MKPGRLRGGFIPARAPRARAKVPQPLLSQPPASGLCLIQFSGPPGRAARAQRAVLGVDLLDCVPEDARGGAPGRWSQGDCDGATAAFPERIIHIP